MRRPAALSISLLLAACAGEDSNDDLGAEETGAETSGSEEAGDEEDLGETGGDDEGVDSDPFIPGRDCDQSLGLTWQNFGQAFMLNHCAGCHSSNLPKGMRGGAPENVNFETHELVQQSVGLVYVYAGDENDAMPPVDSLPSEERVMLGDWLACGAP